MADGNGSTRVGDAAPGVGIGVGGKPMMLDTLVNLINGMGGRNDKLATTNFSFHAMNKEQLENSYRGDWIARKIVNIPAQDATREWREWDGDKEDIAAIETYERKLGLQRKVYEAMCKGRLYGGGALIIGIDDLSGNLETPLDPTTVQKDQLKFVHAVSRWDLTAGDVDWDVRSEYFGQPKYYTSALRSADMTAPLSSGQRIHPSRIVRFLGSPLPDFNVAGADGWSDSVLQAVTDAIMSAGMVANGGANLVNEMKVDVIKVPNLTMSLSNQEYADRLQRRFGVANLAKSLYSMLLLDKEEEWERITAQLTGLPDVLQMYLLMAAAAADIPATRMLSQSPKGMNATGDSDTRNYYDHVKYEQVSTVEPSMNILDECLIRSALGDITNDIGYGWKSLWQMDEVQKATMEKTIADAHKIDVDTGLIPADILREARVNQLIELNTYPGLDNIIEDAGGVDALSEMAAEEAAANAPPAGLAVDPATGKPLPPGHPAHAQAAAAAANQNVKGAKPPPFGKAPAGKSPAPASGAGKKKASPFGDALYTRMRGRNPRAMQWRVQDGVPRALYVYRSVLNAAEIIKWAKTQDINVTIRADDMHVTVVYSREPIDWLKVPEDYQSDENGRVRVKPGGARELLKFGNAIVLAFNSSALSWRHRDIIDRCDGSHDYEDYTPHITLAYVTEDFSNVVLNEVELRKLETYTGEILLGPEVFREITEVYVPDFDPGEFDEGAHPRVPAGMSGGGQFGSYGGVEERKGLMNRARNFISGDRAKQAINGFAKQVLDRDNQREAFSRCVVACMYHGASVDMSPELEEAVRHEVANFGTNAKIGMLMARDHVRTVVGKLVETRLSGRAMQMAGKFLRSTDAGDDVLDVLHKLKDVLDDDTLWAPRKGDPEYS